MANFTEEEFQIELKTILNFYISRYETQEKPKAFLLGGQPGAGKSKLEYLINTQEKCAFVSGDDFRKYHPRFEELNNIYGQESSKHTQEWAGKMVENIVQKLRKKKINLILEGTLRTSEIPLKEAKALKEAGYYVELNVVAVKPEISYLGTLQRYEKMIQKGDIPRMTPKEHHDNVVANIGKNLDDIYKANVFSEIKIFDRENNYKLLYSKNKTSEISPKVILDKEFNREWREKEVKAYSNDFKDLIKQMQNRKADEEQVNNIKKIRNEIEKNIKRNKSKNI